MKNFCFLIIFILCILTAYPQMNASICDHLPFNPQDYNLIVCVNPWCEGEYILVNPQQCDAIVVEYESNGRVTYRLIFNHIGFETVCPVLDLARPHLNH